MSCSPSDPTSSASSGAHTPKNELFVLPSDVRDIGATRQHVLDRFGDERFIMSDDDITSFRRRELDPRVGFTTSTLDTEDGQREMLDAIVSELETGVSIVTPSPGGHVPNMSHWPKRSAANALVFLAIDGPSVRGKGCCYRLDYGEDVDFVLQVLSSGLDCVQLSRFIYMVELGGSGGIGSMFSEDERQAMLESYHRKMLELWPDHVVLDGGQLSIERARLFDEALAREGKKREVGKRGRPKKDPSFNGVTYESESSTPVLILAGPKMAAYVLQTAGDRVAIMEPQPHRVYRTERFAVEKTDVRDDGIVVVGDD